MLGNNYLKVNNEFIPNPVEFNAGFAEPVEVTMTAKSGKTLSNVIRLDQRLFSGTWYLSSFWLAKFKTYASSPTVAVTYQGNTYTCRARGYSPKLVDRSEYTDGTDGLWELSMDFTEE